MPGGGGGGILRAATGVPGCLHLHLYGLSLCNKLHFYNVCHSPKPDQNAGSGSASTDIIAQVVVHSQAGQGLPIAGEVLGLRPDR